MTVKTSLKSIKDKKMGFNNNVFDVKNYKIIPSTKNINPQEENATVNLEDYIIRYPSNLSDLPNISTENLQLGACLVIKDQNPQYLVSWNGTSWQRLADVNVQSDWNETDNTKNDFIKNKPNLYLSVASVSALPTSPENNSLCFVGGAVLKWYYYANLTAGWVTASDAGIALQDVWTAMSGAADAVTYESSDLITVTRDLAGIATPFKLTQTELFAALPNTGSLGPVDAKVDGIGGKPGFYTKISSAISSGANVINWNNIQESDGSVINITRNITIFVNGSTYKLANLAGFNIAENCTLAIYSDAQKETSSSPSGPTFLCNNGAANFFQGQGKLIVNGICFISGGGAGTLVSSTLTALIDGCQVQPLGTNNQFINLQCFGSKIKNSFIFGQALGADADNALVIGSGCEGENIEYYNSVGSTGTHITIQPGGKLSGIKGSGQSGAGGMPLVINNAGYLEKIYTSYPISPVIINDSGVVSNTTLVTATGFAALNASIQNTGNNSKMQNINFVNADISIDAVALNATILNCQTAGGTYVNNATSTQGFANSGGLLPNSVNFLAVANENGRLALTSSQVKNDQIVTQDSDKSAWIAGVSDSTVTWFPLSGASGITISPFTGGLDGKGLLTNFYATFYAAYTALKTYLESIADITETQSTTLSAAQGATLLVGQKFNFSLAAFQIIGSSGNSINIDLADASSKFSWGNSSSLLPIANFDALSTLIIKGNGGTIQNNSTADNSYLECLGTTEIECAEFLLPNASAGGIKTHLKTMLKGVKFVGKGASSDTPILSNGGSLRDLIFEGPYKDEAILIQASNSYSVDTVYVNVSGNTNIEIWGSANNIISNPSSGGYLKVILKNSSLTATVQAPYNPIDSTRIFGGTFDELDVPANFQGGKVFGATIGLLACSTDNSSTTDFFGCTFINQVPNYGLNNYYGCKFLNGIIVNTGSTANIFGENSGAEQRLSSLKLVDLNVTSKSALYTVPSDKNCVITRVIIREASTSLTAAEFGFGFNSASDDVIAATTYPALTDNTTYTILAVKPGAKLGLPTNIFGLSATTPQGSAATISVDVYGYLF